MKLFGKKTLALLLALTMMLSLCSFTAFGAVESVTLDQSTLTLEVGQTKTLTPTVTVTEESAQTVTWQSSDKSVATVSDDGVVTAVAQGAATISAKSTVDADKYASCEVTVTPKNIAVTGISITNKKTVMVVNDTFPFTATVQPDNATDKTVTWESTNTNVATVGTDGTVTAKAAGTTNIVAKAGTGSNVQSASVPVSVVENNIIKVNDPTTQTKSLDYGKTLSQIKDELSKISWSVKYGNATTQIDGTATIPANGWASANFAEKKAGQFTFTGSFGDGLDVTVTVTINKGQVKEDKVVSHTTYKGVGKDTVITKLPSNVEVNLTSGGTYAFSFGSTGDFMWVCDNYDPNKVDTYTFTAVANNNSLANEHFANIDMNGKTITAKVSVTTSYPLPISETMYYGRNTSSSIDLEETIRSAVKEAIKTRLNSTTTSVTFKEISALSCANQTYGKLGTGTSRYIYTVNSDKLDKSSMKETFTYSALDTDGVTYSGTLELTITSNVYNVSGSTSTSSPIWSFSNAAKNIYDAFKTRNNGTAPDYIEFGDVYKNDDELGELRDANAGSVEGSTYSFSSSDDDYDSVYNISFVPTGKAGYFRIDYTAYYDTGSKHSSKSMSGTITIDCVEMLVIWLNDLAAGETQSLSSAAIQEQVTAILDTTGRNAKTYTLDTVTLSRPSTGTLYDGNNKKVTSSTKALDAEYVDDYTYEAPSKVTSGTLVTLKFSVKCKPDSGKSSKPASGVMLFNLIKKADITISAPANGYATLDASLFTDYCADHVRSTHKNYELCYVEFTGAPNSTAYGYLYENYKSGIYNGAKIKSPNGKKFALTDISAKDKNAYDLESVSYVPGTRNCTGGTFTIYGVKPGETIKSSTKFVKLCDGTIDFVIDGGSVSGNTKKVDLLASQTYSNFYYDLINSNVASVRFVSVTGGKLIYRDVSSQAPITPGTDVYYLGSTGYLAGRRMLSNVVFLPGYNQTSATITLKAFDAKDKSANAQYIFTIKPVTTSSFSDMNGYSSYAGSVGLMTNLGIINGVGNNKFNPSGSVTRGEWITMLYRAAGSPAVYSSVSFTDVPSWCKDAVQWAVQNGITDGIGNNKFGPDMTLDRMQIVTFMYRFAKLQGMDVSSTLYLSAYTDGNTVDAWAQPAMKWALQKGYLDPVGGKIQPKGTMTRVLVADCLTRLLTK